MTRRSYCLYFAWLFACIGTLTSLYFSDIIHFDPCHLCWFQRIFLFPMAILLGMGAYRGDKTIVRYTLPLIALGFLFALYQIAIQEIPGWNPIEICGAGPSCAEKTNIGLGFITIPMLSAGNFLLIALLLILSL